MRRSFLAGIGALAVFVVAACSPDQSQQEPLAPTVPSLAPGGGGSALCAGSLLSDISKQQKALFTGVQVAILDPLLTTIKNECPTSAPSSTLMTYIQRVIDYRKDGKLNPLVDPSVARANALVKLWSDVTTYAMTKDPLTTSDDPLVRQHTVLLTGSLVPNAPGTRGGGAAVLDPNADLEMFTFDNQAGVQISGSQVQPVGPHLYTLNPSGCPNATLRQASVACYDVEVYPAVSVAFNPAFSVGMCVRGGGGTANTSISHEKTATFTELLPPGNLFPWSGSGVTCHTTHPLLVNSWLGREAGPLGRALAKAIDYLRPQPLFADDAGESGLGLFFSPFGGVHTVAFADSFSVNPLGTFANGATPVVGSPWTVVIEHPGSAEIQNALGDLSGKVLVISQALGNCDDCPEMSVLATRDIVDADDDDGSYEIYWSSVQTKSSVKEAPFVVQSATGVEIARLSYVTQSSVNRLMYNGQEVGSGWTRNVAQHFRITVNLTTSAGPTFTTTLAIRNSAGAYINVAGPVAFTNSATSVAKFGYVLSGIDAGVIGVDNLLMRRLTDNP
ncbi:MAG TPA: hypothetical protein VFD64_17300 [Gemmatimonadaceae bacterium]|nr:hypothetical protein [Gemmatimonadaceae bacterium]